MKFAERVSKVGSQHSLAIGLLAGLGLFAAKDAVAAEYYVSPTGSDSNPGTQASPFATLSKANNSAAAGDTIWMRAGSYSITSQLTLSKSGTSDTNRTKIWAYQGEVPILDISNYGAASSGSDVPAVLVTGSWMHLKGLEIANAKVGSSGSHSYSMLRTKNASNNTFELLNIHNGFGPGLFIDTGTGGNLILNCDSHDNYDKDGSQGDGQNGDGFGVHYQTTGPSTVIRGCRSWHNSDDGYDLISQEVPVTVENSFATGCGYGTSGNGNGFKMGSSKTGIRHIVQNNVAWKNAAAGFYANHSSGGNNWYNNTSYNNGTQYNMLASTWDSADNRTDGVHLTGTKAHVMRNNIGFPNKNSYIDGYGVDTANNTWDLGIAEAASDFVSTSDTPCTGPREADGSMPAACTFMHLAAGSPLIDKGKDVGLPYVGSAPDLGAYEYGATGSAGASGTGGATGAGGATGTGGATSTGGRTGTGGATANGGATASGGTTASGGAIGSGGRTGSGGAAGAGGALPSGGVSATGGASGTGGAVATGGSLGTGGSTATGGRAGGSGTGGAGTTGGTVGTGGSVGTGGTVASGGAIGTGGFAASGGVAISGGSETGGSPASGGTQGGATGGTTAGTATPEASASGCSCRIAGAPTGNYSGLALLGLVMVALRLRRKR
jgi:MYXO-CTERM domain-containing protein